MELKNKRQYEVQISSYFEGESIENLALEKELLEDDFWTMIRLSPAQLPTGRIKIIPAFFSLRLMHKDIKAYNCLTSNTTNDDTSVYTLNYPALERTLAISYETKFPHRIIEWNETYYSGWGEKRKKLTTHAKRIETIKN